MCRGFGLLKSSRSGRGLSENNISAGNGKGNINDVGNSNNGTANICKYQLAFVSLRVANLARRCSCRKLWLRKLLVVEAVVFSTWKALWWGGFCQRCHLLRLSQQVAGTHLLTLCLAN